MSWPVVRFEELYSEPSRNGVYKQKQFHGSGVRIVNMGELFSYDFISDQEMKRLSMSEVEMARSGLADGDLLFGRRSLVEAGAGKCSLAEGLSEPTTFESSIIRVRVDETKIRPRFLYYWLKSHVGRGTIRAIVTGVNVKGIKGSVLKNIQVPCPKAGIQDRIVQQLRAYDDLIENNRRRIQLLEQAARLLYKEWFVHLRFPGHEHVKIKDGIPEGWQDTFLPDVIDANPKTPLEKGKAVWCVPMAALSESGMSADISNFELRTKHTNVKFKKNDVLLARITPCLENGKTGLAYFLRDDEVACGSTEFIVLREKKVSYAFTYCLARSYPFRENAIKSMIGSSGRQRVQVSCLAEYKVPLPPAHLLEMFDEVTIKCFEQIKVLMAQTDRLTKARDLLLPRLMSGEVAV